MFNRSQVVIVTILLSSVVVLSSLGDAHAFGVVATVTVGTLPFELAYDSVKGEIFVLNGKSNTISVIDDRTNTVVSTIPVGGGSLEVPHGIVYDSGMGEIFLSTTNNNILVISDTSDSVIGTISGVGGFLAYDSIKGEIFATQTNYYGLLTEYTENISIISDLTNAVIDTIPLGFKPYTLADIVYDSGKGEIWASGTSLAVISDASNSVVATVSPLGSWFTNGYGTMAYDSGKGEIFVTYSDSLYVVSDSTNTLVATILLPNGLVPATLVYDSAKGEIFVSDSSSNATAIISDNSNKVIGTVNLAYPFVYGL
jgi:YVTN family beta-propeller protein